MPFQGPSIQAFRDSRVAAHAAALEAEDRGRLLTALVETSGSVGNLLATQHGGPAYDVSVTVNYLTRVADTHIAEVRDGLGSATFAAYFGVTEFCSQDSRKTGRRWSVTWRHNGGGSGRPTHIQADGLTVPVGQPFGVTPAMGSVGCACTAEPNLR